MKLSSAAMAALSAGLLWFWGLCGLCLPYVVLLIRCLQSELYAAIVALSIILSGRSLGVSFDTVYAAPCRSVCLSALFSVGFSSRHPASGARFGRPATSRTRPARDMRAPGHTQPVRSVQVSAIYPDLRVAYRRTPSHHPARRGANRAPAPRGRWAWRAPADTTYTLDAMSSADLSGQVVAVTGASSGIGEATALACARAGAAVALAARRGERIEELAERIVADGGRAVAIATDVGEEEQAGEFVRRAHSELGRLDVLVNNAGVMLLGPIADAPTEEWRRMIHANVFGVLYCTHAALPLMREQGAGHIVNVSSVAGRVARAGLGRLQPHEVRRRRLLGVPASGGRRRSASA